jgi:hypothetical protein
MGALGIIKQGDKAMITGNIVEITREKIQAYEDVRQSGETNMFHISNVVQLSGLTGEEVREIMNNYIKYIEKFDIKRG